MNDNEQGRAKETNKVPPSLDDDKHKPAGAAETEHPIGLLGWLCDGLDDLDAFCHPDEWETQWNALEGLFAELEARLEKIQNALVLESESFVMRTRKLLEWLERFEMHARQGSPDDFMQLALLFLDDEKSSWVWPAELNERWAFILVRAGVERGNPTRLESFNFGSDLLEHTISVLNANNQPTTRKTRKVRSPSPADAATQTDEKENRSKDMTDIRDVLPGFVELWEKLGDLDALCAPSDWPATAQELKTWLTLLRDMIQETPDGLARLPTSNAEWLERFAECCRPPLDADSYARLLQHALESGHVSAPHPLNFRKTTRFILARAGAELGNPYCLRYFLTALRSPAINPIAKHDLISHLIGKAETEPEDPEVPLAQEPLQGSLEARQEVVVFHEVLPSNDNDQEANLARYRKLVGQPLPMVGQVDSKTAVEELMASAPWLEPAIRAIRRKLDACLLGWGGLTLPPLLLVGPPATGKSWIAERVGEMLGVPTMQISAGGSSDNRTLKGTSRGYGTGRVSHLVEFIANHRVANPLVVVDEIDKVSDSNHNGNLHDLLHQLLDRQNSRQWVDDYLLGRCDLSHVSWIATANKTSQIKGSLLSRFHVVEVPAPGREHRPAMLHSVLKGLEVEKQIGCSLHQQLSNEEWELLCKMAKDPRFARQAVETLMAIKIEEAVARPH